MIMKNYINLIYCLLLFTISLSAQGWEQTYPITSSAKHILPHPTEGYMVLGNDKLSHINNEGESIWSISQGGQYMIETSDGAFLIAANPSSSIQLSKVFPDGTFGNSTNMNNQFNHRLRGIVEMDNGDLVMTGIENESTPATGNVFILRTDSEGNFISEEILNGYFAVGGVGGNLLKDDNDNIILTARRADIVGGFTVHTMVLMKFDPAGQLLWESSVFESNPFSIETAQTLISTNDDGYCLSYLYYSTSDTLRLNVIKFTYDGNLEWTRDFSEISSQDAFVTGHNYYTFGRGLTETLNGDILVSNRIADASSNSEISRSNIELRRLSSDGSDIWNREIGQPGTSDYAYELLEDSDGNILLGGLRSSNKCLIIKLNSDGYIYTNVISGNIAEDLNGNCQTDSGEPNYQGWIVEATGYQSFFTLTDEEGNYELRVDSGTYIVNAIQPNPYRSSCVLDAPANFPLFNGAETIDFPITEDIDCPYLIVDIGTPFLRRCFPNIYHVNYCNSGTSESEDTFIEIDFDSDLTVNSSTANYAVVDGTYIFDIGTLAASECGDFTVSVTVGCDSTVLGQTHCVEARIYPDSICLPIDPNWSGASLDFSNIMLPDSNINEMASHGFVKFKISQQTDNPIGSMIHNEADIYFDNNSPILTNDAWHTIGEDYITTTVSSNEVFVPNVSITNYPNPFGESTTFEISGEQYDKATLRIYDVMGRSIRSESFENNSLRFLRNGLVSGLYFYEIIGTENLIGSGKLVVE
ncbi:MAG: hypothetical protein ACJATF_002696 [Flavobacteriales bacterium]|jgi:hypothetical protein